MRRYALCVVLLAVLPASATISYVRSASTWSGGTTSCAVGPSTTTGQDLLAVWVEWQTAGTNTVTVSQASDSHNAYRSAGAPTVQSTGNIAGQIWYAANIGAYPSNIVTLTFSGTVASSACVTVEFSGADLNYPLDSVSAGYSSASNPTNLLDSGNAAPANSNLMIFAAGFADTNSALIAGSNFTSQQASHGTWGTGIVENSTTAISGNTVLQRATACLGTGLSCSGGTADWLMQMAIFRDASWSVAGGWSPTRPPDVVNAAQYPGPDICVQAQNAANANPYATILMTITGTMPCSVDPSGGWISGFYNNAGVGGAPQGPSFNGNIKLVGVVGTNPTLQIDVPWLIGRGPNARNTWTDIGGVTIQASKNFRINISGPRCFSAGGSDNTGDEADCAHNIFTTNQVAISAGVAGNCAKVTLATTVGGGSVGNNGNGDPQVFRANQIVNIMNAADARNNGVFRIVPQSDTNPCSGTVTGAYNQFFIYAPSAQSCTPGNCGSGILVVAESPMFYMSLRDFDMPTANACPGMPPICTGDSALDINGAENDGKMVSQGNKLLNLGEVDGIGYGIVALDNHFGQEQTWVTTIASRAVIRTSMMSFGAALNNNGSQNTEGFSHWEDYCGDPHDTTDCYSDGTHIPFGLYHVGLWLRDGWGRVGADDVTFNSSAYAHIMLDGMTGFTSGWTLKDLHFQNERTVQNVAGGGGSTPYTGGNLCDIAIGFQSQAQSVILEQVQADSLQGVLENICIAGSNHLPTGSLPNWTAAHYLSLGGMFIPTANNPNNCGGPCIMEVISPVVGGTSSTLQPNWATSGCSSAGGTCSDGGLGYENIGGNYPNDIGPSNSGNVIATNLTEGGAGATGNIFNGVTNNTWSDQSISWYIFQDDSGSIDEESSSHEHAHRVDQGINTTTFSTATYNTATNCSTAGSAANPSVANCGSAVAGAFSCDYAASGGTCIVQSTKVTPNSDIIILQNSSESTRLGVTCDTTNDLPAGVLLASKSGSVNFTINLGTVSTLHAACFDYWIVN